MARLRARKLGDERFRGPMHAFWSRVQPRCIGAAMQRWRKEEGEREGGRGGGDGEVGHRLPRRDATYTMRRDASAKRIGLVTSSFRKRFPPLPHLFAHSPVSLLFHTQRKRRALMLQIHSAIKILPATSVRTAIVIKIDPPKQRLLLFISIIIIIAVIIVIIIIIIT